MTAFIDPDPGSIVVASRANSGAGTQIQLASAGAPQPPRQRRVSLAFKTLLGLLAILIMVVGLCGFNFLRVTRNIATEARRTQILQFATSVSLLIHDDFTEGVEPVQEELIQLRNSQAPDVDFIAVTDPDMHLLTETHGDQGIWDIYHKRLNEAPGLLQAQSSQVLEIKNRPDETCLVASVPIFDGDPTSRNADERGNLLGYLHVGAGPGPALERLHYLEGSVGLTCLVVVALAFPVAFFMARHILIPIQQVVVAARALGQGKLSHRVFLRRRDEIGELVDTFNMMAHKLESQQAAIKEINNGLEIKVRKRTSELESVNKRLQAEMLEKEEFLRAVSHDLNAPLRNIAGMASMLMLKYRESMEQDALQRLDRIQKNVEVECELINELLELSRIKTRREKLELIDLQKLVESVRDQFSSDLEMHRIDFQIVRPLPQMEGEKMRLRQVFQNLIDNAVKYMRKEDPREIRIGMWQDEQEVVLYVADTGMGVAAEELPNLFHVFRRAKSAAIAKIPGKGVGLASVKSIIENYNGRIWVESTEGNGTTFYVGLPRQHFPNLQPESPQ